MFTFMVDLVSITKMMMLVLANDCSHIDEDNGINDNDQEVPS